MADIELHPAFADLLAATSRMKADADSVSGSAADLAKCITVSVQRIDETLDAFDTMAAGVDRNADKLIEDVNAQRSADLLAIRKAQDTLVALRSTFTAEAPAPAIPVQQAAE